MPKVEKSDKKLKILLLGGTSFLGPHQTAYALERGHEISIFTQGNTCPIYRATHQFAGKIFAQ